MSEESKCPVTGKNHQHGDWQRHNKPGLVAEPVESQYPPPAFFLVQSDGRGVQLR